LLDGRSDWNYSRTVSGMPRQWNTLLREISGFSVGKAEESSCEVQELGSERVIVEVCGERVHDGTADGGREHHRRHARLGSGVSAHEETVEAVHHLPERVEVREEPDQDRIADERALHATALDGEVDDPGKQRLVRAGNSMTVFEFNSGGKIRHLDVYLQQPR